MADTIHQCPAIATCLKVFLNWLDALIPLFLFMMPKILLPLLWTPQIPLRLLAFPNPHNQSTPMSQNHPFLLRGSRIPPFLLVLPRMLMQTFITASQTEVPTPPNPSAPSQMPLLHVCNSENLQGFPHYPQKIFENFYPNPKGQPPWAAVGKKASG